MHVREFVQHLIRNNRRGIMLDIDDTLGNTALYWFQSALARHPNPEALTARELQRTYRYVQNVPCWQEPTILAEFTQQEYDPQFHATVPVIRAAQVVVNQIHKRLAPVLGYLTARVEKLRSVTEQWLLEHRFPVAPILMRPSGMSRRESCAEKVRILAETYPWVQGLVEDNPSIADALPKKHVGTLYLYDHFYHVRQGQQIVPCASWSRVFHEVQLRHPAPQVNMAQR